MSNGKTSRKRFVENIPLSNFKLKIFVNQLNSENKIVKNKTAVSEKFLNRDETLNFKSLMEHDEVNEKHLQAAIKYKQKIPVPEINEIGRDVYDRLYPSNYKIPRIRILDHPQHDFSEYDIDTEDEEWLTVNSKKLNLSKNHFEEYMEFLENNCNNKSIPRLDDLKNFFKSHNTSPATYEKLFDYWLGKRLSLKGRKLMHHIIEESPTPPAKKVKKKEVKENPYIAFRARPEKMRLRKNRARDYHNYKRMLIMKEKLEKNLQTYKEVTIAERTKFEYMKTKFEIFTEHYEKGNFNSFSYFNHYDLVTSDRFLEKLLNKLNSKQDSEKKIDSIEYQKQNDKDEFMPDNEECFAFDHKEGNNYFKVNNVFLASNDDDNNDEPDNSSMNERFYNSTHGFIRRRVGRGGRIVIDRVFATSPYWALPEYVMKKNDYKTSEEQFKSKNSQYLQVGSSRFCLHYNDYVEIDPNEYELVFE